MITTKTLPLVLKAATATMPASVVGQRPTIAMVTAINSQKAVLSTDVQNTPVNLQTSSKVTGPGAEAVQIVAKNTVTLVSQQLLFMGAHIRGICICKYIYFMLLLDFFISITLSFGTNQGIWLSYCLFKNNYSGILTPKTKTHSVHNWRSKSDLI